MKKVLLSLGLIIAMLFQFNESKSQVFPGSTMANSSQELVMKNWLGNDPGGTLLYRKSRDGASGYTFHQLCDNQGPTVVLIKTSAGTTFGGFASESWGNNYNYNYYGGYIQANGSFLFNLTTGEKFDKGGYYGSTNPYGMYSSNDYGPTFGGGHDLHIQNDMQSGYVSIGYSYTTTNGYSQGSQQAVDALVGPGMNYYNYGNSFQPGFIVDIEVYKITYNYSSPIVLGRNIIRYLDATGQVTINTSMIDSASSDPDGIASITIDKTSFDCSNVGGGSVIPVTYLGQQYQETRSHGGGFNPNTNQFYYPEWAGSTVYVYDINHNYVSNFYTGQNEMMQLWMEAGTNDYYTANWSQQSITKRNGSSTVWTYNANALMSGVSSDANYVYAIGQDYYYSNNNARKIVVLNKSTGVLVREIQLPGDVYTYGGLVVANDHIYIAGQANGFSTYSNDMRAIHIFKMDGTYESSTPTVEYPYNMAYDGETMWISANSNNIYGYKISNGNTYSNNGSGSTVRLTVVDLLGNSAYKDYYVQLRDTIIPSITLNGNIIEVAPFGGPYNELGVTANDNCPKPVTITGTVDVDNKGIYPLSYVMKDAGGNTSNSLSRTVYVGAYDTTAPIAIGKNITLTLDGSGTALLNFLDVDNGSFDANGLKTKAISKTKFDCSNIGANTVTLTVEDYYGHSATTTSIVTVVYQPDYTITQNSTCVEGPTGSATVVTQGGGGANYYGTRGNNGNGSLLSFDPTNGTYTIIGSTGINQIPAMAVSPITGNIYATNGQGSFYQLNPTNGQSTYIGYMSYCSNIAAMAFNAQGVLYANDACGYMYTVDLTTGNLSYIGNTGRWFSGMQFDPIDGSLWATDRNSIYTIDLNYFGTTNIGYTNYSSISDLVFSSTGDLYGLVGGGSNSQIISINKNNGIGTFIANTISNIAGASRGGNGLSFLWSNGQTTATATNLNAGSYTVTISSGSGCSKTDTVVFTQCVPVPPVVTLTATSTELCEGSSSTLTASAVAGVGNNTPTPTALPSNLIGYWKFDENSGTTVSDQTTNGLNGTFVGSNLNWANATVFPGSNSQLQFNGAGYVEVQNNAILNSMNSSFTIESWVYQTDYDNNTIVDRGNYNFLFEIRPNGTQGIGFYNANTGWYYSNTAIQPFQWTHVAVTYSASNSSLKFYKNGVLTDNFNIPYALYFDNGPLNIGRQSPSSCQCNIMNGSIDELRVWNTVRTEAEIAASMNSGLNTLPPTPTFTYNWSPSTGLNTNSGEVVIATPNTTTTYTVTVTDSKGATATESKNIVVNNLANPVITANGPTNVCPGSTVELQADASGTFTYQWYNIGFQIPNATSSTFNATTSGSYSVEITSGLNCSVQTNNVNVTIGDSENPVALTNNISRTITSSTVAVTIAASDIDNGSNDNCSIASMTVLGNATFDCSTPTGTYTVTLQVTDGSGNTSTKDATVTITNSCNTAPIAICKTVSIAADGNTANVPASGFNNGSSDPENDALLFTVTPSGPYSLGTTNVVFTVTDPAGLFSSCNSSITVIDSTLPSVITQSVSASLDASGNAIITTAQVNNGSSDNVGIVTYSLSNNSFNCSNLGANTVTLFATDAAGNSGSATATVTVVDVISPTAITQNFTVNLDANGTASISVADINNGSSDNCSVASISLDKTTFNCSNLGANTVTLTVVDGSGNSSTATAIVTVNDVIAPIAITQNFTVNLDANGTAIISVADINNGSSDNCSVASISLDKTTFNCSNLGANAVTLTVVDGSGNNSTATATVSVIDAIAPIAIAQNFTVNLDANGTASISVADINNGSSDNCSVASISLDNTSFNCSNLGANTVTLTVVDGSGNTSTATATVSVIDAIAPIAIAQNFSVNLDANGTASISVADINNGSTDNCSVASISLDNTSFNCSNLGANTVTLTVVDGSGNTSTATATVTVNDVTAPTALVKNLVVQLDANGMASVSASQFNDGSFDNCSIADMSVSQTSFNCTNVGVNTLTFTITDGSGNSSSALVTVLVQDVTAPIITASADQVFCEESNGTYTIQNITATDNCAVTTTFTTITGATSRFSPGLDASGVFAVGTSTVTWTVMDAQQNTSTSSITVTINPAPVASITSTTADALCNEVTLTAGSTNAGPYNYAWSTGETTQSISLGLADADGIYTVYVTDANGCNSLTPASYNFQKETLASSYTILAFKEVELEGTNIVQSGSVGVMRATGEAEFEKGVSVTGVGSFTKSPKYKTKGTVTITNKITGVATVALPTMQSYAGSTNNLPSYSVNKNTTVTLNSNYKDLTVKKGANATINGSVFRKVTIEEGATVKFTSAVVNIEDLSIGKGSSSTVRVRFAGNTSIRIKDKVKIEGNAIINQDNYQVTFYFASTSGCNEGDEDKFSVKGGNTTVNANVLIPGGKIKVENEGDDDDDDDCHGHGNNNGGTSIYMKGLFVGNTVKGDGKNIYWNTFNCVASANRDVIVELTPSVNEESLLNLLVYPNPALSTFNFKLETMSEEKVSFRIFDVAGRLVFENTDANPNESYNIGETLTPGVYMVDATQGSERKVLRVVKTQ